MFYSLTGKVVYVDGSGLAVDCGGVAFRVNSSMTTLKKIGEKGATVTVYTYMSVREDAIELFGFADPAELDFFRLLVGVSGVGPKAAIAILSVFEPDALAVTISSGDSRSITKAQGVGPKLAQRIVLELKDKVAKSVAAEMPASKLFPPSEFTPAGSRSEAVSALIALGYSKNEATAAVNEIDPAVSVEDAVKAALRILMRRL